jgi:hypothetical protein
LFSRIAPARCDLSHSSGSRRNEHVIVMCRLKPGIHCRVIHRVSRIQLLVIRRGHESWSPRLIMVTSSSFACRANGRSATNTSSRPTSFNAEAAVVVTVPVC